MHEIYGSICESKCKSGFDWSTFQPNAVNFDRLWPKGSLVNIIFSLPDHRAVVHLKEKTCKCLGPWAVRGKGSFYLFIALLSAISNNLEKPEMF